MAGSIVIGPFSYHLPIALPVVKNDQPSTKDYTGVVYVNSNVSSVPIGKGVVLQCDDGRSFKLIDFINSGGMADVYKASDDKGQIVAAKVLKNWTITMLCERFHRETALMAEIKNYPGVISYISSGKYNSHQPFIVMEYADGGTLNDVMSKGSMSVKEQLIVIADLCKPLQKLHSHKNSRKEVEPIIHRDLKPSNILFVKGKPKISDFGLAAYKIDLGIQHSSEEKPCSITKTEDILGTPKYMSPEQAGCFFVVKKYMDETDLETAKEGISELARRRFTPAADRYSIAAMLYQILTGELPLEPQGESTADFLKRVVNVPPMAIQGTSNAKKVKPLLQGLPPLPEQFANAIMKSLLKTPLDRTIGLDRMEKEIRRYAATLN